MGIGRSALTLMKGDREGQPHNRVQKEDSDQLIYQGSVFLFQDAP